MASGEDWIMRPILEGMCMYRELIDGTLSLVDLARMNEALDVRAENERRITAALERQRQKE